MTGKAAVAVRTRVLHGLIAGFFAALSGFHAPQAEAAIPQTTLVGSLPGQFSVESGAATYSIPLALPSGIAGMQPELAISYNSNGGSGLLGVGFSLDGLSVISRCPATFAQDGFRGGVYYNAKDRYCLDGQRLIAISGGDGGDGTEYRTEIDGHSRVISYGQQGSGPSYWKVWTKSGQILEYGNTADAKVEKQGATDVRTWAVNQISDTVGNAITFSYQEDTATGEHYPTAISYGPNSVQFEYEDRPDPFYGYHGGGKISLTKRLNRIAINTGSTLILEYALRYRGEGNRSLLEGVAQKDGDGNALPERIFDWDMSDEDEQKAFEKDANWQYESPRTEQKYPEWGDSNNIYSQYLDMNGDGLLDRVNHYNYATSEHGIWVALNNGRGFDPLVNWQLVTPRTEQMYLEWGDGATKVSQFIDINGDGLPDRVNHYNYATSEWGIWVALNNGSGFDPVVRWQYDTPRTEQYYSHWADGNNIYSQFLDMNGDGLPDRVNHYNYATSEHGIWVALNNGSGFDPVVRWQLDTPRTEQTYLEWGDGATKVSQFIDMNGDGLPDRVNHYNYATSEWGIWVALNNGSGFDPVVRWQYDTPRTEQYYSHWADGNSIYAQFLDINGDGLPDRVNHNNYVNSELGIWVALNNGSGFEPLVRWQYETPQTNQYYPEWGGGGTKVSQFVDVNGDGLPDRVNHYNYATGESGIWVALNNGSGFDPLVRWQNETPREEQNYPRWADTNIYAQFMDVNGDGQLDRVNHHDYSTSTSVLWTALNKQRSYKVRAISEEATGNPITITYKPLTDSSVYTKGTGASYPEIDLAGPMQVVSRVETSNGIGGTTAASYTYGGAKANVLGRGLLGFAWTEVTDESTGIVTRTEFRQDFPYTGMASRSEQRQPNGTLIAETTSQYDHALSHADKVYSLHLTQSVEKSYELDGSLVSTTTTDNSGFDAYGNVYSIDVTTTTDIDSYSKVTENDYENDEERWILGRLTQASVTHYHDNGTQQTRTSAFTYNATTGLLESEIVEPDSSNALTTSYQYDSFGNKTGVTISSPGLDPRTSTTTYDATGRFPISSSNALGHSESKAYDPVCGKISSLTGPNGLTTTWSYDSICRKIGEQRADGTSTSWAYAWNNGSGPQHALYKITETSSGSAPVSVWYDTLGREIRKESTGYDGRAVYQDSQYNALGQLEKASLPYFENDTAYWVESSYDLVGRVTQVRRPGPGGGYATSSTSYQGRTTVETNALGQIKTAIKSGQGKVIYLEEEEGAWVEYEYDAVGNLIQTNASGVITTMEYDARGHKIAMDDPDMGHWSYDYNAYGELIGQTDAKDQTVTMEYDALGRMIQRVEPEGTSSWTYDTAANGIGKLAEVNGPEGYHESYSYDSLGRPSATTTEADGKTLTTSTQYDAYSRVSLVTRPEGFLLENVYNTYGYLQAIRSPTAQIGDYDATYLNEVRTAAADTATLLLDQTVDLVARAAEYRERADNYRALSRRAPDQSEIAALLRSTADTLEGGGDIPTVANTLSNAHALLDPIVAAYNALASLPETAANLDASAAELEQLAEETLAQANTYLHWAETPELSTILAENTVLYDEMTADSGNVTFWRAKSRDAAGRLTSSIAGNGLVSDRTYDPATGQLLTIQSGFGYAVPIRFLEYQYDDLDNVTSRQDHVQELTESFEYDDLNRLTRSTVNGQIGEVEYNAVVDHTYDALGNMLSKSDVGNYTYGDQDRTMGNAGPHALISAGANHTNYQYDLNGNILQGGGRSIQWTSFNKPKRFEKDGKVTAFYYGPDRARYLKITAASRTLYLGKAYERIETGTQIQHKHFLYADGQLVAIHIKTTDDGTPLPDETRYLHRDALGSIDTITNGRGTVVDRMSFEAFGKRRAGNWRTDINFVIPSLTNRGFTGHEHIDEMGLIHMNGRVYDPELGRFLSADPHIQNPYSSQSYNRYSYVLNNPLKYTDPSGYFSIGKIFKGIKKAAKSVVKFVKKYWRPIVAIAAAAFTGGATLGLLGYSSVAAAMNAGAWGALMASGAAAGFVNGAIMSGSLKGALKGALYGGISAGIAGYIGANIGGFAGHLAHGITQGGLSEAFGGDFKSGFIGAFVGHFAGAELISQIGGTSLGAIAARTTIAAVAGGIGAKLGGGKFENGAVSAAFSHLFNNEMTASQKRSEIKGKYGFWVEASSPGEPGSHLSLGVGDPNGKYHTFSYGHTGGSMFGGTGAVYLDSRTGGEILEFYPTTWEQSEYITMALTTSIGTEGTYNLARYNCRHWTYDTVNTLKSQYGFVQGAVPARSATPRGSYPGGNSGRGLVNGSVYMASP